MPRPKGSKKEKNQSSSSPPLSAIQLSSNDDQTAMENKSSRPKKNELINVNDDGIIPTSSSSEGRVVVNPAVLRYLEQNRSIVIANKNISMDIHGDKEENVQESMIFPNERYIDMNMDLFWDDWTCSTEFLTSARLAEWILTQQTSAKVLN